MQMETQPLPPPVDPIPDDGYGGQTAGTDASLEIAPEPAGEDPDETLFDGSDVEDASDNIGQEQTEIPQAPEPVVEEGLDPVQGTETIPDDEFPSEPPMPEGSVKEDDPSNDGTGTN